MITADDLNTLLFREVALREEADELAHRRKQLSRTCTLVAQLTFTDQVWTKIEHIYEEEGVDAAEAYLRKEILPVRNGVDLIGFGDGGTQCLRVLNLLHPIPNTCEACHKPYLRPK